MTTKAFRAGKRAPNTVFELSDVSALAGLNGDYEGQQVSLAGWHPSSTVGGGTLAWNPTRAKSDHNGGTVFSPTVPWTTTTADYLNGVGETDPAGLGAFERIYDGIVYIEWFGAKGDDFFDNTASITRPQQTILSNGGTLAADIGDFRFSTFYIRPGVRFIGSSKRDTVLKPTASTGSYGVGLTQPNSRLENLTIEGSLSSGYGVLVDGPKTVIADSVIITGFYGSASGLDGVGAVFQSTWSHKFSNCEITNNRVDAVLRNDGGEVNNIYFDNCTIEQSDAQGVIIDRGVNVKFDSCSFGYHGTSNTDIAIDVNHADATVMIVNTWFEFCQDAIDFAGSQCVVIGSHIASGMKFRNGKTTIFNSEFFGFGGHIETVAATPAEVLSIDNVNVDSNPIYIDGNNGIYEASKNKISNFTGALNPETSGTISVNTGEDVIREEVNGKSVTVSGRLLVSATSSPIGSYVALTGLTYPCASLSENSDHSAGSCMFYNASATSRTAVPAIIFGGQSEIWIYTAASNIEVNDTLTINITYPIA